MSGYTVESVRWLKGRARTARAVRNFTDANTFLQIAREIEDLREACRSMLAGEHEAYIKMRKALEASDDVG